MIYRILSASLMCEGNCSAPVGGLLYVIYSTFAVEFTCIPVTATNQNSLCFSRLALLKLERYDHNMPITAAEKGT